MKPLRAPWQVWAVVALAPVLWLLYEAPGDPHISDPTRPAILIGIALLLLLLGSKLAWVLSAGYTGALGVILLYQLFDPTGDREAIGFLVALTAATLAQFALFVAPATMDWVGVKDGRASSPPAAPTG
jgi:hypothetical protein